MVRGSIGFNRYISILIFQKGEARVKKQMTDVFEYSTSSKECSKREHPTQKEIKLVRKLIDGFSKEGDIVFDPFLGSGTTAVACKELGRNFIGFEISPEYCEIARKRVENTKRQLKLETFVGNMENGDKNEKSSRSRNSSLCNDGSNGSRFYDGHVFQKHKSRRRYNGWC